MALGNLRLVAAMHELIAAFRAKGREFGPILETGAAAAAGRRADDARTGVHGIRRNARRRGARRSKPFSGCCARSPWARPAIGTGLNAPAGYGAEVHVEHLAAASADCRIYLAADPDRGDAGHAGVRPLLVVHEEPGDQALEGLQRPAPALVRIRGADCARSTCRRGSRAPRCMPGKVTRWPRSSSASCGHRRPSDQPSPCTRPNHLYHAARDRRL